VAGLKEQMTHGVRSATPDGLTPGQQLAAIKKEIDVQYQEVSKGFLSEIAPALASQGIVFSDREFLDDPDLQFRLDEILDVALTDDNLSWTLDGEGAWTRTTVDGGVDAHVEMQDLAIAWATARL
jgi:polyphosphate kinase